jgi:hypothetical protein
MEKNFDSRDIKDFELKIFLEGQCNAFMPMSFIVKEKDILVTYFSEGYIPIMDVVFNNPFEMLQIVEKLLLCVKDAENHLIPLSRFSIGEECIYFSKEMNRVCLMFKPVDDKIGNGSFAFKTEELLKKLKDLTVDMRICEYLDMVIDKLSYSNIGREALTNYIGELKRDVHICGWR